MNRALPGSALLFVAMACKPSQDTSVGIAADGGSHGGASDAAVDSSGVGPQGPGVGGSNAGTSDAGTEPEVLYQLTARPITIEVDETHLYWNEVAADLSIMAAPKDGSGPVEKLGEWNGEPMAPIIATDDVHVYWSYDTRIIRIHKGSRERTEIELGEGRKAGVVGDTDFLYLINRDCTAFVVVEKSSLTVNMVPIPNGGQDLGGATAIAMDRDDVFCSHGQFIHAISKKDRTVRDLVRDTDASDRFASTVSDGEMLFWINRPNVLGTDTESLRGRSKAGSSVETLAVLGRNAGVLRFDAERGWLYTIANNPGGVPLLGYSLATKELQELATNQLGGGGITFDSKYIYWTIDPLEPAGSIMRMRAPEEG